MVRIGRFNAVKKLFFHQMVTQMSSSGRGRCSIHSITLNVNIKFVELNSIWFGGHLKGIDAMENPIEVERKNYPSLQAADRIRSLSAGMSRLSGSRAWSWVSYSSGITMGSWF